jgi:hypothetical protein
LALPVARRVAIDFLPYVLDKKLELARWNPTDDETPSAPQIVIFNDVETKTHLIYDRGSRGPLLEVLISDNLLIHSKSRSDAEAALPATDPIPAMLLEPPERIQRHFCKSFESRKLEEIFEFLASGEIERLEIKDRYLVSKQSNKDALLDLMAELQGIWNSPPAEIIFIFGPTRQQHERAEWLKNAKDCEKHLKAETSFVETKLEFRLNGSQRIKDFHDRIIRVSFKANADESDSGKKRRKAAKPIGRKVIVELSGGIDVLMDNREETRVYVFDEERA